MVGKQGEGHVLLKIFVDGVLVAQQDTDNRSRVVPRYAGKQLPERPADELYTRVELFSERGRAYYEFNFVSGNFLDQINFDLVPSRGVHTIGAAYRIVEPVTMSVEARNLTDNRISDVAGFPLPGRAFFGTVAVKF